MRRRTFILSMVGALAGSTPLFWWINRRTFSPNLIEAAAWPEQLSLIADEKDILTIGDSDESVLRSSVDEINLTAAILEGIPQQSYNPMLTLADLRHDISNKIEREFKNGQTRFVKGWILSETEVRQCRLYTRLYLKN